jgi:SSS family solute:Na+ symporter
VIPFKIIPMGFLGLCGLDPFYPSALVQLSVLSYEGLAQLVPIVLLALFWRRMTAAGAVAGLVVGTTIMLGLWLTDHDPLYGVNGGLIALVANLVVNAAVSYIRPAEAVPGGPDPRHRAGSLDPR